MFGERTHDDRGNLTDYVSKADDGGDDGSVAEINRGATTQRYLARVLYGNRTPDVAGDWMFEVVFDHGEYGSVDDQNGRVFVTPQEDRPWPRRADAFSNHRSGFDVRTRRLCQRVLMVHHFPDALGQPSTLVRSTDFTYDAAAHLAKLERVVQRTYLADPEGGYAVAELPATQFTCSEARPQPELRELDEASLRNLPRGLDGEFRLLDLDGEGLPGIVAQLGDALHYKRPLGDGRFGALTVLPSQPTGAKLGRGGQLVDLDGDGRPEMMRLDDQGGGVRSRSTMCIACDPRTSP